MRGGRTREYKKSRDVDVYFTASPVCSTVHTLACPVSINRPRDQQDEENETQDGRLTTTSFAWAGVTRLSSQYNQPPLEAIKAVSAPKKNTKKDNRGHVINEFGKDQGKKDIRTVSTTQAAEMVRDTV